jgi:hypothetical protein
MLTGASQFKPYYGLPRRAFASCSGCGCLGGCSGCGCFSGCSRLGGLGCYSGCGGRWRLWHAALRVREASSGSGCGMRWRL